MFDVNQEIDIKLVTGEGDKAIKMRFPSDEQMERRQRGRKIFIKDLGRGATEADGVPNHDLDAQIVAELKIDGDDLDPYESTYALDTLTEADATDAQREGSAFRIFMKVPGAQTEHVLSIPTQKQLMEYRRLKNRVISLPFGRKELRLNLNIPGDLYKELCSERKGYVEKSSIPLSHRICAVEALVQAYDREVRNEQEDPANF